MSLRRVRPLESDDVVVVGAAVIHHGRVLAARRTAPADLAGGWELPGGKVDPGESPEAAVVREIREELGCTVEVTGWMPGETPIRPGLVLRVAFAALFPGEGRLEPAPHEHDAVRWLAPEQLREVAWLDADRPFLPALQERLLDGCPLPGGNVGGAVRIGATVRRRPGPWTPAVHALLDQLTPVLREVPRCHGFDDRGREVLTYLPGRVLDAETEPLTDGQLGSLAAWTRGFHDAVAGFTHPGPWRLPGVAGATVIGHNDLAPYNLCFEGDHLVGVFDWDVAGPTTPLLELAFLAWSCVPLWREVAAAETARRLELVARSYGGCPGREILHAVPARIELMLDAIPAAASGGDEGMAHLLTVGEPGRSRGRLAQLVDRIPSIEKELS